MAKKKTFEEYLERLEAIADDLEEGDLPLEEALKKYEQALKAFRLCQQMLKKAEQRIEILLRNAEGELKARPFEPGTEAPEEAEATPSAQPAEPPSESANETETKEASDELFP